MNAPLLFEKFSMKGVTARNRIVVSPMCQYRSVEGSPTDWHLVNLGRYAIGGAGIIFCEETAVETRGRKTSCCATLHLDEQIPSYRRITDFLKELGAVPAMQLGHSGSRGSEQGPLAWRAALSHSSPDEAWETLSASDVPVREGHPAPRPMNHADIQVVIEGFVQAARRSLEAGFDILEIHGAHGYLIHQFLSPLTNRRTDRYGGDLKARMRFALELTEAVRAAWPEEKPLFYRASCVDGEGGSWNIDDTVALAREFKALGVDVFDCSSGGIAGNSDMPRVKRAAGYHLPFARRVRSETGIATMAPGLITMPEEAEASLRNRDVDLVGMARELMRNSDWPVQAAHALGIANYLDLLPRDFAFRLRSLEEQRKMLCNFD